MRSRSRPGARFVVSRSRPGARIVVLLLFRDYFSLPLLSAFRQNHVFPYDHESLGSKVHVAQRWPGWLQGEICLSTMIANWALDYTRKASCPCSLIPRCDSRQASLATPIPSRRKLSIDRVKTRQVLEHMQRPRKLV